MKTVIVCCGNACATSAIMEAEVCDLFKRSGVEVKVIKCMVSQVEGYLSQGEVDLIIPSGRYTFNTDVPVISGMAYITGVGIPKLEESILAELRK